MLLLRISSQYPAGYDAEIKVFDARTGKEVQRIEAYFHGPVYSLCCVRRPNSSHITVAAGSADGNITIYSRIPGHVSV